MKFKAGSFFDNSVRCLAGILCFLVGTGQVQTWMRERIRKWGLPARVGPLSRQPKVGEAKCDHNLEIPLGSRASLVTTQREVATGRFSTIVSSLGVSIHSGLAFKFRVSFMQKGPSFGDVSIKASSFGE